MENTFCLDDLQFINIDENTELSSIPVKKQKEDDGYLIDIEDIYSYYNNNQYNLEESINNILSYNMLDMNNVSFVIKEDVFYVNPDLREISFYLNENNNVLVSPYNVENDSFYQALMESIYLSIENNDENYLDYFLQEGIINTLANMTTNAVNSVKNTKNRVVNNSGNKIKGYIDKKIGENFPKIANQFTSFFGLNNPGKAIGGQVGDAINTAWDKSKDTLKGVASKYMTGAKLGAAATAGLGIGLSYLTELLNPSEWSKNPGGVFSGLKNSLKQVTGLFKSAPPEKKGFFQNLINKIQNALRQLGAKFGLK